jgi:hypothetical protein
MEYAEWIISGLDQLRLGRLPAGNDFYNVVSDGLGDDPRLAAYMNSGSPQARAELIQLVADAVAANPGFEERLRTAAAIAQPEPQPQSPDGGKKPFFKTTNGMLVAVAAAVVVVGGGIGLGLALSAGGSNAAGMHGGGSVAGTHGGGSSVAGMLKGAWTCNASGSAFDDGGVPFTLTVGDGVWRAGIASGTWTQNGSTATIHDDLDTPANHKVTGLPSGAGPFDVSVATVNEDSRPRDLTGTISAHRLTAAMTDADGDNVRVTCRK